MRNVHKDQIAFMDTLQIEADEEEDFEQVQLLSLGWKLATIGRLGE
jgi:hypothetical protein